MKKGAVFAAFVFVAAFLLFAAGRLHPFGEPSAPAMDDYFLAHSQAETGANNVVTAIVFDYRGFDTLGEATVLFAAILGVVAVFRGPREDER